MSHTKKNNKQAKWFLPITIEDKTVKWEKGTAAMERWPHCSQLD
jgi:hypothetical protein